MKRTRLGDSGPAARTLGRCSFALVALIVPLRLCMSPPALAQSVDSVLQGKMGFSG